MAATVNSLPVSTSLLAEINAVGDPKRDKAQDGTIGDTDHEQRASDHNRDELGNTGSSSDADSIPEVHARDADARGPWKIKGGAERIVQLIVANVRARGHAKRRVKYVIFKRRIWRWRKVNGEWAFVQSVYTGSDPHDLHFHVSFEYGSGSGASNPENDTSPWGILAAYLGESDDMQESDWARMGKLIEDVLRGTGPTVPAAGAFKAHAAGDAVHRVTDTGGIVPDTDANPYMSAGYTLTYLTQLATVTRNGVNALLARTDNVDEAEVARLVLAGLTPQAIAAAIPPELAEQVADNLAARLAQ